MLPFCFYSLSQNDKQSLRVINFILLNCKSNLKEYVESDFATVFSSLMREGEAMMAVKNLHCSLAVSSSSLGMNPEWMCLVNCWPTLEV